MEQKIKNHMVRQLYCLAFSRNAFEQTKEIAEHYLKMGYDEKHALHQAFATAAATMYSRPFIKCRNMPTLPGCFSSFNEPKLKKVHDSVVGARNMFYAHADATAKASLTLDVKYIDNVLSIDLVLKGLLLRGVIFDKLLTVCNMQIERVAKAYQDVIGKLYPHDVIFRVLRAEGRNQTQFNVFWPKD